MAMLSGGLYAALAFILLASDFSHAQRGQYADICFVIDSSGSIAFDNPANWGYMLSFVSYVVGNLDIGSNANRVAVVIYSTDATVEIQLSRYNSVTALQSAITSITYLGQGTNTYGGLRAMNDDVFRQVGIAGRANIAFLMTDGVGTINQELTASIAATARSRGIQVIVMGITENIEMTELSNIASQDDWVILASSFTMLEDSSTLGNRARSLVETITSQSGGNIPSPSPNVPSPSVPSPSPSQPSTTCSAKMDIVFVVDSSGSINDADPGNWQLVLQFLQSVVRAYDVGPSNTRFGVVVYSELVEVEFYLDRYDTRQEILDAILTIPYMGSFTNTAGGIEVMDTMVFQSARGDRSDAMNVAIVITDGKPNMREGDTVNVANAAKARGIDIIGIGVTDQVDMNQIRQIASSNAQAVFATDFSSLADILSRVVGECPSPGPSPTPPVPTPPVPTPPVPSPGPSPSTCSSKTDVVFVVDSSGSINDADPGNWQLILEFLKTVVSTYEVGPDKNLYSIVVYSEFVEVEFYLDAYTTKQEVLDAILTIPYMGSFTNTAGGIEVMDTMVFQSARGDRSDALNVAIVITDGKPNLREGDTVNVANAAKARGIDIIGIGITDAVDMDEIRSIATSDEQALFVSDFSALGDIISQLTGGCPGPSPGAACTSQVDLAFVVDSSGSINDADPVNWNRMLDFMANLVDQFTISSTDTRVGVALFSTSGQLQFLLNAYTNAASLKGAIRALPYVGQRTNTADGLQIMNEQIFVAANGDRASVSNVAVVITDGQANERRSETAVIAQQARDRGIIVIALGITNQVDVDELRSIATSTNDVFTVMEFDALHRVADDVVARGCRAPSAVPGAPGPTGPMGPTGPSGPVGAPGPIGISGPRGNPGPAGPVGATGSPGQTVVGATGGPGPRGLVGETGRTGRTGSPGSNGSPGVPGDNGRTGSRGPTGPGGPTGPDGSPGRTGSPGRDGSNGATGNTGRTGITGGTGSTGPRGLVGNTGPPGRDGNDGPSGRTGATGRTGPSGQPGNDGRTGRTGAAGPTGQNGRTGAQGRDGPAGRPGGTGVTGRAGRTGATGSDGRDGRTGSQGTSGRTGGTGATGFAGRTGSAGRNGSPGRTGSMGATGPTGRTGATGGRGPSGPRGDVGPSGRTGSRGVGGRTGGTGGTGPTGITGATGSPGRSGPRGQTGVIGRTGPGGRTGSTGSTGPRGSTGIGSPGATGRSGPSGRTGGTGRAGPAGRTGATGSRGNPGVQGRTGGTGAIGRSGPGGPAGRTGATGGPGRSGRTGATGIAGPTGREGPSGPMGRLGRTGATGRSGGPGRTGATGGLGRTGPSGPTGNPGPSGRTGATGLSGPLGRTGPTGDTGRSGRTGATGSQGRTGRTGGNGATGRSGSPGRTGATGGAGRTGSRGFTGPAGRTGATGSRGSSGRTGSTGSPGPFGRTGSPGPSGRAGDTGRAGRTGATGRPGNSGPSGPSGGPGRTGATGFDGRTGSRGPSGPAGRSGATGRAGPSGRTGATGSRGSPGPSGRTGSAGPSGRTGARGFAGPSGRTGNNGATGRAGRTGATGFPGPRGFEGPIGPRGPAGPNGRTGGTGSRGPQGVRGSSGPSGPQGRTGATGNPGPEGPRGFVGNQGRTGGTGRFGPSGPTGARGGTGPTGRTGATGARGRDGSTGSTGPRGFSGMTGSSGFTGRAGRTGATGERGFNGFDGRTGSTGATGRGRTGSTGARGFAGGPGRTGATGRVGATGSRGLDGTRGRTGATGSRGPTGPDGLGRPGRTGATGREGRTGSRGSPGQTGMTGAVGRTGAKGDGGSAGLPGASCYSNECFVNNGGCHHQCIDTYDSYYCACDPGYAIINTVFTCPGYISSCSMSYVDLVFVLDSSGSICSVQGANPDCDNWRLLKQFVKNIISDLDIGQDKTRVGLVRYSNDGQNMWFLNDYYEKQDLLDAVDRVSYAEGNTNTSGGIWVMRTQQYVARRGDRPSVPNMALVITDGVSTYDADRTIPEARLARAAGIQMFTVGVTRDINIQELREISSEPQTADVNYFTSVDFTVLDEIVTTIVQSTCQGGGIAPPDCSGSILDLVFVLDSSGSIRDNNPDDNSYDNYDLLLAFVNLIVDQLTISQNATRIGVVRFANIGENMFFLNTYSSKSAVKRAVTTIGYVGGNTNTSGGLRAMQLDQFTADNGDRPNVPNIAIVITDGVSTFDSDRTIMDANSAKNDGITIYSIGITASVNEDELRQMSSMPQEIGVNYWTTTDFGSLESIVNEILAETCRPTEQGLYCRYSAVSEKRQCYCMFDQCDVRPVNGTACLDVDECYDMNGGCEQTCVNTDGSYECVCTVGLILGSDMRSCIDVNECADEFLCPSGQECINTYGSYYCLNLADARPLVGVEGVGLGVAGAGITTATLGVSSALTALVTTLVIVAILLGIRHFRRQRKLNKPPTSGRFMPDQMATFNSIHSKFGPNPNEVDIDAISNTSSAYSSTVS